MSKNKHLYSTEMQVRSSDINYGGHLGNDRFLAFAQEARARWLASLGSSEKKIAKSQAGLIVKEAHIQFLKEAFLGEVLTLNLFAKNPSICSLDLICEITNKKLNESVGLVETKVVFFDYSQHKIVKMPEEIKKLVKEDVGS